MPESFHGFCGFYNRFLRLKFLATPLPLGCIFHAVEKALTSIPIISESLRHREPKKFVGCWEIVRLENENIEALSTI